LKVSLEQGFDYRGFFRPSDDGLLAGKQNMDINWQTGRSSLPIWQKSRFKSAGIFNTGAPGRSATIA
jgi:hypothetical protein